MTKFAEKAEVIDIHKRVEVVYSSSNPYGKPGTTTMVHPRVAKKGRELGHYEPEKKIK